MKQTQPSGKKRYQALKTIGKIVISGGILYFLFRKCDWVSLVAALQHAEITQILLALLFVEITHVVGAMRWQLLCNKAKFWPLFKLVFVSRLYSTILPGQLFGEAAKVVYISQSSQDITPEEATVSVVVDKIVGLIGLLLVGIGGALFSAGMRDQSVILWFAICAAALVLIVALPAWPPMSRLINRILDAISARFAKTAGFIARLKLFLTSWQAYLKTPHIPALSVTLGAVFQLISTASMFFLGRAIGIDVALADWCWIFAVLSIALLLPVSFAGLGVREATLVGFLGALGVRPELALSVSLLSLMIQIFDSLIGGVITLFDPSMRIRKRDQISSTASNQEAERDESEA